MKPGSGKTPFLTSFRYAWRGIRAAYRTGFNIRVQTAVAVLVVVLGLALRLDAAEWCAVLICCGLVIGAECINSAIEDAVDLAEPRINPLAERAKDMAAGAVSVFSIMSVAVGCIVFLPRILAVLG
ncbi:diacylglycerol kinase [Curtanaerobium respiraculi]|uniref:diacylglycerol kinase n=1 Tax=Curtanaerobium respiraculi TaxID=2949669 RepID=UPI0024B38B22|nr:diacylglycerol kinase family protein [Curtanaerobium respiraculi]